MSRNWSFRREEIALKMLPSGHRLTAPVLRLRGKGDKKCYIQANNHGGEIAGNGAIFSLLTKITSYDIYGTIIIVPHCNPVSLNTQIDDAQIGVYDAATGKNWNRLFQLPWRQAPAIGGSIFVLSFPGIGILHGRKSRKRSVQKSRKR